MDKIEELKKLLWILDSKYNVSVSQTKENIDFIADEIVKLFCPPAVVGQDEQLVCDCGSKNIKTTDYGFFKCNDCENEWDLAN